jgi:hypothetical protein
MKKQNTHLTPLLTYGLSLLAIGGAVVGVRLALASKLFILQKIEVSEVSSRSPLDASSVIGLAKIPIGKLNLVDLDLDSIEKRILVHPWIRSVRLEKKFPHTLSIQPEVREPVALLRDTQGRLAYVDSDAFLFGPVKMGTSSDLPLLGGAFSERDRLLLGIRMIQRWKDLGLDEKARLDAIEGDKETGVRLTVVYNITLGTKVRTVIDLGQEFDTRIDSVFQRLGPTFDYLKANQIQSRLIWADLGKKIVVKIARGS